MTHEEALGLLTDRLFDDLDEHERARLEEHLERCSDCREKARQWSAAWEVLGKLDGVSIDPAAHVRFGRRLERARSGERSLVLPRVPLLAAAAAALLVAGGLAGRALAPDPAGPEVRRESAAVSVVPRGDEPRFILLLRGDEPDRRRPADVLVREYGEWAASLAGAGSLVAAEELEIGTGRWVPPDADSDRASARISGFFLIEAPSYDSAVAIARASPHAAYGGVIEVRRIADEGP